MLADIRYVEFYTWAASMPCSSSITREYTTISTAHDYRRWSCRVFDVWEYTSEGETGFRGDSQKTSLEGTARTWGGGKGKLDMPFSYLVTYSLTVLYFGWSNACISMMSHRARSFSMSNVWCLVSPAQQRSHQRRRQGTKTRLIPFLLHTISNLRNTTSHFEQ